MTEKWESDTMAKFTKTEEMPPKEVAGPHYTGLYKQKYDNIKIAVDSSMEVSSSPVTFEEVQDAEEEIEKSYPWVKEVVDEIADIMNDSDKVGGIDDGGERITYGENGAIREPSTGKGRYDLISPFALRRLARWYELGAMKYADRNWEKGIPFSRCIDSAKRHIDKYLMGWTDEDHLAAAAWNIFAIIHYEETGMKDFNDLPDWSKLLEATPKTEDQKI